MVKTISTLLAIQLQALTTKIMNKVKLVKKSLDHTYMTYLSWNHVDKWGKCKELFDIVIAFLNNENIQNGPLYNCTLLL